MPEPSSRYQSPSGATPAASQSRSSAWCVPLSSPREAKTASTAAIACSATTASAPPAIPAGSSAGPTMTKSLYITSTRSTPKPSATKASSAGREWTKTMSASPRLPVSSAWPVPCATTRTSIPLIASNSGRMWPKRPEASVEVVEATVMKRSCAAAGAATSNDSRITRASMRMGNVTRADHHRGMPGLRASPGGRRRRRPGSARPAGHD